MGRHRIVHYLVHFIVHYIGYYLVQYILHEKVHHIVHHIGFVPLLPQKVEAILILLSSPYHTYYTTLTIRTSLFVNEKDKLLAGLKHFTEKSGKCAVQYLVTYQQLPRL